MNDGSLYYNSHNLKTFLLGCPSKRTQVRFRNKNKAVNKTINVVKTSLESHKEKIEEGCINMKAVGRSFTRTERKTDNYISRRIVAARKFECEEHTCKRFCDKWKRMTEVMIENNKALKIENRLEQTPIPELDKATRNLNKPSK